MKISVDSLAVLDTHETNRLLSPCFKTGCNLWLPLNILGTTCRAWLYLSCNRSFSLIFIFDPTFAHCSRTNSGFTHHFRGFFSSFPCGTDALMAWILLHPLEGHQLPIQHSTSSKSTTNFFPSGRSQTLLPRTFRRLPAKKKNEYRTSRTYILMYHSRVHGYSKFAFHAQLLMAFKIVYYYYLYA